MSKIYTKDETKKILREEFKSIETFYNSSCVNWRGKTSDSEEYYAEIIAEEILKKDINEVFEKIEKIERGNYYIEAHHKKQEISNTNRKEEIRAKEFFKNNTSFNELGKIIDYQIPLKSKKDDKAGKIDLLSYNEDSKTAYVIEFKYGNNADTLLKTVLEIYTYLKRLDTDGLTKNFEENYKIDVKGIKLAVLVTDDTKACEEAMDLNKDERKNLKFLIEKLGVTVVIINYESNITITSTTKVI